MSFHFSGPASAHSSGSTGLGARSSVGFTSESTSSTGPGGTARNISARNALRNSLPFIPDIDKDRAAAAVKSINTAWNNGNFC